MSCSFYHPNTYDVSGSETGCQFQHFDFKTVCYRDKYYCPFHLPQDYHRSHNDQRDKEWWKENFDKLMSITNERDDPDFVLNLSGIRIPPDLSFSGLKLSLASFGYAEFVGDVNFCEAEFFGYSSFKHANFGGTADFSDTVFHDCCNFEHSVFHGPAMFVNVKFDCKNPMVDWHIFRHIDFKKAAVFNDSQFTGDVHFQESNFNFLARFENVQFDGYACFDVSGATTSSQSERFKFVSFKNARLSKGVSFQNRHFSETTDFSGCSFLKAPQFHGAHLHQDTNFAGSEFLDTSSEYAAPAYRTLKLAMEDVRAREEEANFYALEQRSLRSRQDTAVEVKVTSWLYEAFSDYGRNFMLPLGWLSLSSLFFFSIYYPFIQNYNESVFDNGTVFAFTVEQTVRPFWIWLSLTEEILRSRFGSNILTVRLIARAVQR